MSIKLALLNADHNIMNEISGYLKLELLLF